MQCSSLHNNAYSRITSIKRHQYEATFVRLKILAKFDGNEINVQDVKF